MNRISLHSFTTYLVIAIFCAVYFHIPGFETKANSDTALLCNLIFTAQNIGLQTSNTFRNDLEAICQSAQILAGLKKSISNEAPVKFELSLEQNFLIPFSNPLTQNLIFVCIAFFNEYFDSLSLPPPFRPPLI